MLHFLAVAARPVLLPEVADFIAVDLENRRRDVDAQFQDPQDILTICSSLITSTASPWPAAAHFTEYACEDDVFEPSGNDPQEEIRLAHLSVKEWLITPIIRI